MSSPTNLTDSLTRLRERRDNADSSNYRKRNHTRLPSSQSGRERRFATDSFMIFAYSLLGLATICQLILIVWLDII